MKTSWMSLALCLVLSPGFAIAQTTESAPQEAPFVDDSSEFNDAFAAEEEIFKSETVQPEVRSEFETDPIVAQPEPQVIAPVSPAPRKKAPSYSSDGKKVARKNAKGGVEYIQHPQAAKGLIRIEKDGSYIYKAKDKDLGTDTQSISLRMGAISPPKIKSVDGTTTFETMYTSSQVPILLLDYEWQPFSGFGKLGVVGGLGLMTAQGNGRFANGQEAEEKYTFYAIPLNLGVLYRLEFTDRQWVAPYVGGGGSYFGVLEMRDDGKSPNMVGVPGFYGAAGAMFNVGAIDRETAFTLRDEYGIRNLWVTAEYRQVQTVNDELDFSSGVVNVGVSVDY